MSFAVIGIVIMGLVFAIVLGIGFAYKYYPAEIDAMLGVSNTPVDNFEVAAPVNPIEADSTARLIHQEVNEARELRGIAALRWDPRLASIAEAHSADMLERGYFDHVNPDGLDHRDRYEAAGMSCMTRFPDGTYDNGSENLTQGGAYYGHDSELEIAEGAVLAWLTSTEGHGENVLAPEWESEGIGVVFDESGRIAYITQNFC